MNLPADLNPALPATAQQKLRQTLSQWRHWRPDLALSQSPELVEILDAGKSNYSILVNARNTAGGASKFVVRIDGQNPASHSLSRSTEWRALNRAFAAGIAPQPVYFNPELGSLVCAHLESDTQPDTQPNTAEPPQDQQVGQLLRAIHALPTVHHRLDLQLRIARYEKKAAFAHHPLSSALLALKPDLEQHHRAVSQKTTQHVFCHNDLLAANRILSGGVLRAIDWEYCAMGPAWYDLAVIVHGDGMSETAANQLLEVYLAREPTDADHRDLHHYGCIYRYVELLWYMQQPQASAEDSWLELKIGELRGLI